MSISNAMLLHLASGVPYGFRDRQRFELVPQITCCKKMCKQSSQQSDQSCFCTNTRATHTRQNKPYRLGAVRAGVVGARSRCCPAATVPVTVVFPCGVCCCIARNMQNIINNRKTELCHRPQTKAHSNEYENNTHKAEQALLFQNFRIFLLDLCVGTVPKNMGTAPRFWRALPLFGDNTFPKYVY